MPLNCDVVNFFMLSLWLSSSYGSIKKTSQQGTVCLPCIHFTVTSEFALLDNILFCDPIFVIVGKDV